MSFQRLKALLFFTPKLIFHMVGVYKCDTSSVFIRVGGDDSKEFEIKPNHSRIDFLCFY